MSCALSEHPDEAENEFDRQPHHFPSLMGLAIEFEFKFEFCVIITYSSLIFLQSVYGVCAETMVK